MDPGILELVKVLGVPVALCVAIILAGAKGKWVYGREFDAMREERDEWKAAALDERDLTRTATATGERLGGNAISAIDAIAEAVAQAGARKTSRKASQPSTSRRQVKRR